MEVFHNTNYTDESLVREKSSYDPKIGNKHLIDIINQIEPFNSLSRHSQRNI